MLDFFPLQVEQEEVETMRGINKVSIIIVKNRRQLAFYVSV